MRQSLPNQLSGLACSLCGECVLQQHEAIAHERLQLLVTQRPVLLLRSLLTRVTFGSPFYTLTCFMCMQLLLLYWFVSVTNRLDFCLRHQQLMSSLPAAHCSLMLPFY